MEMTPEQERLAVELFGTGEKGKDGKDRLTVRFDPETLTLYKFAGGRPFKGYTLLNYTERPDTTPTGGRYVARRLTIRTRDGRKWVGQMNNRNNVVRLRPADDEE